MRIFSCRISKNWRSLKEYTYGIQNIIARFAFMIVLFICTFVLTGCSTDKPNRQNEILRLTQWQYHRGDLPKASTGNYRFPPEGNKDSTWLNSSVNILPNHDNTVTWFRTLLPGFNEYAPAVFVNRTEQIMSVYLDRKEIYSNSNFILDTLNLGALSFRWFLVKLPKDFTGKYLYFRFTSKSKDIGMASQVSLGSADRFLIEMASENIADTIIGAIILLAAIVMLTIFIFLKRERFYLGLSLFFFSTGTLISMNNPFVHVLLDNTPLIFSLDNICLLLAPFLFVALEEFVLPKYLKAVRFAWKIHLVFLVAAIICLIATNITSDDLLTPFFILLLISSNTVLFLLIKSFMRKRIDYIILLIGTTVFSLLATTEIFLYYINYYSDTWYTRTYMLQWGTLFFVGSLLALAMYRYLLDLRKTQFAQEQLVKQQQLTLKATQKEIQTREHFTHQLMQSQDNERKRIAMELHDAVGQELLIIKNLASLGIKSISDPQKSENSAEYLKDISETSSSVIESVRTLSKNLHPYQLENLGISESLEAVIQRLESSSPIQFKYSIDKIEGLFTREQELHIYRILQELLNNIIKHSAATSAEISVTKKADEVNIVVTDNGKGYDLNGKESYIYSSGKGFGLSGINERVSILRGSIQIDSVITKGTSVQIHIPMQG